MDNDYSQPGAPVDVWVELKKRRKRIWQPSKEAKRLQMARYRARYPAKMREYWRRYKAAKRAEARYSDDSSTC